MNPSQDDSLSGKRVVISAGGSGIGRSIALHFRAAGAAVHVCDVSAAALAELATRDAGIHRSLADVSDPSQVQRLFAEVEASLGGLDFLVNCAGIAGPTAYVEDITPQDWQQTVAVNLHGTFYCTRQAVPLLKRAKGGAIVSLSSAAGRLGYPMRSPYAAAKWALIGFTQSIAMELGPFNIRANAILPGSVEGDRMARVNTARAESLGISVEEVKAQDVAQTSLRRYVPPEHIASMALYLCSEAGSNITGQSLNVCGNVETLR